MQIDNLKISKEQLALTNKEQTKTQTELEGQIDSYTQKLDEKSAELHKTKAMI